MASSPALRPQNQRQREHVGILQPQELNKIPEKSRVKPDTVHSSKRGAENRDPNESAKPAKGVNKLTGVSRLPVLAKTLRPAVTEISLNPAHARWEERPLLGKAQKRKTCTKPVPFSLSQPRPRSQKATETCSEPANKSGKPTSHLTRHTPAKTLSFSQRGTENGAPTENPASGKQSTEHANNTVANNVSLSTATLKLNNSERVNDIVSVIQKDLSTKLRNISLAHSELTSDGRISSKVGEFKDRTICHPSTNLTVLSADYKTGLSEGTGDAVVNSRTPRVSKCSSGPGTNIYLRVSVKKKNGCRGVEGTSENTVPLSPDPSALRSILLNEGIKVGEPDGATPRVSTCPPGRGTSIYSAQRVPIRKPLAHTPTVGEAAGAVRFSPDPSALRTILLNEGVKQGAGNTPRAFPSGRATSIYSAQRVPVKKAPTEDFSSGAVTFSPDPSALRSILQNEGVKVSTFGATTPRVSVCPSRRATSIYTAKRVPLKKSRAEEVAQTGISQTPVSKWTPQRVPASQSRSVRGLKSTHNSHLLSVSPGFGEMQASSSSQQEEEVVQRLFQEEPEHESNEQNEDEVTSGQTQLHHQSAENKLQQEVGTEAETNESEKAKVPAAQPFIQAPHRQSVIVFSSGQKLFAPNGAQPASIETYQHAEQLQPFTDQTSRSQSGLNSEIESSATPGKLCKTKASSLSSAVCALRRRLPPLEEMFLDEECAMYTSRQQSWPAHPRCYNPVASTLFFQDSICFVPIIMTCPSMSPVPHFSSPVKV